MLSIFTLQCIKGLATMNHEMDNFVSTYKSYLIIAVCNYVAITNSKPDKYNHAHACIQFLHHMVPAYVAVQKYIQ